MENSKFQTKVTIPEFKWKTGYLRKNVFMGSCFTENVGNWMAMQKYQVDVNPFGILYNPVSVANGIQTLLENKEFSKEDLIFQNGLWHSFFHHGRFSGTDPLQTLNAINTRVNFSSGFLKKADFLFITFGTAWIYKYTATEQIVSNCHKINSEKFIRSRLTVNEITELFNKLLDQLWNVNQTLKIVFTVSPIRHWKDGATESQLSKAVLLLAIDQIVQQSGHNQCAYFPAYEIVMDELRDYRFYAEDMIHLSNSAIYHIREKFGKALIDKKSQQISIEVSSVIKALNHKPFNKFTEEHLDFTERTLNKIKELELKYSILNFHSEKEYLVTEINEIKKALKHF